MQDGRQTILLIDDDPAFCRLVSKNLEKSGYLVDLASDSHTGIEKARNGNAQLIVLDHNLPDRDGLGTLSELAAILSHTPVIYLTASEDSRLAVAALKAGAADYVVKDIHGDFLMLLNAAITAALRAGDLRRAKEAAEAEILRARDRFKALAEERALLLREMNHRVGNSLQLIASLLHMQTRVTEKSETRDALLEANRRVMAVAQVHRRLYTSDNVQSVSLRDYLRSLIDDISAASGDEHAGIILSLQADEVAVEPDKAVAMGILVTELVLNAMKHAYPGGKGGVRIVLRKPENGFAELAVEDDGVGIGNSKAGASTRLGSTIIKAMAQKLGGDIEYTSSAQGTAARLNITLQDRTSGAALPS